LHNPQASASLYLARGRWQNGGMAEGPAQRGELEALPWSEARTWLRPLGLLEGPAAEAAVAAGWALRLAGGGIAFTSMEVLTRLPNGATGAAVASLPQLRAWTRRLDPRAAAEIERRLERLSAGRPAWAGLSLGRPLLMGVVNVTPDSFSDGGQFLDRERAIAHGRALAAAGADILDIGGESTRPGAAPVAVDEEKRRIEPVVAALAASGLVVSIDTRRAAVMAAALDRGARIVNDVSALADAASLATVARRGAAVALMHMQGEPRTMQSSPRYTLASLDVAEALEARLAACATAGIPRERIVVDPGIGFGKALEHNLEILARLALFHGLGCGVMVGVSRKSMIAQVTGAELAERLPGSIAGALHALRQGIQILRVHDIAETRQAVALWQAISAGG
jgi:dihydropteroate synthase